MTEIHQLRLAQVNLPGRFNPPTHEDTRIDVYGYAVVTGSAVLLVDTGVGDGNAYVERTFAPTRARIDEELASLGIGLEDVSMVVNSHLHFDHCGNNALFPRAEILVQARELEVAREPAYTVREWFDYEGARIRSVAGDCEIAAGVTLLATPGHTPGHQSVRVRGSSGCELIAAQAAFSADEFQCGGDPTVQAHEGLEAAYVASIRRLQAQRADVVYFSHDSAAVGISGQPTHPD